MVKVVENKAVFEILLKVGVFKKMEKLMDLSNFKQNEAFKCKI